MYKDVEIQLGNSGVSAVSAPGGLRYNGSAFQLLDATGQYDPRLVYQLTHTQLNDMVHVLAGGGPVLNGSFKVTTYLAGIFVATETWYTSAARTIPMFQHRYIYPSGSYINPMAEVWTIYDGTLEAKVVRTLTDTMTYSGVSEISRARSYS